MPSEAYTQLSSLRLFPKPSQQSSYPGQLKTGVEELDVLATDMENILEPINVDDYGIDDDFDEHGAHEEEDGMHDDDGMDDDADGMDD